MTAALLGIDHSHLQSNAIAGAAQFLRVAGAAAMIADAFLSLSLYTGVIALGIGLVALLRPIRLLHMRTRRRAMLLLACGAGAATLPIRG